MTQFTWDEGKRLANLRDPLIFYQPYSQWVTVAKSVRVSPALTANQVLTTQPREMRGSLRTDPVFCKLVENVVCDNGPCQGDPE